MTERLQLTVGGSSLVAREESERPPRCRVSLRHYRRATAPFVPSVAAIAGALDIYLDGRRHGDVLRMLFGLSVLRSAGADQMDAALTARNVTIGADVPPRAVASVAPTTILL